MRRLLIAGALLAVVLPATVRAGSPPTSTIRLSSPNLAPGSAETVTVVARDLNGDPLPRARVMLSERLPTRTSHIRMKPTNSSGTTSVVLHPSSTLRGTRIQLSATISTAGLTIPVTASFAIMSSAPPRRSPVPTATPQRTPTRTVPTGSTVPLGTLGVTAQAVPAAVTAPAPIVLQVQVHTSSGQDLGSVPVKATGTFSEGLVPAQGTTDSSGIATLRFDTGLAHSSQTVHLTVSATWQGQTALGSADATLAVPATPTPAVAPTLPATDTPVGPPAVTIGPTNTPVPTDVPVPTSTPWPTDTPVPTAAPSPTVPTSCAGQSCMNAMMTVLNNTRAQYGLPPLSLDLTQSNGTSTCVGSIGHSEAMAQSGSIWHVNPSYPAASFPTNNCYYGGLNSPPVGQNVGMMGSGNEMNDLIGINNLMMGEQHDAAYCSQYTNHACAILSTVYHRVGLGIYYTGGATWLTEDFIG